ncbi:hypothetical protein ACQP04_17845 [Pseudonocardia halophobica]|uniref:hypothetical protein n=1 Tax=Pseudonocardia halophobica TaxID=29401 RepID=UPI003D89BEAF
MTIYYYAAGRYTGTDLGIQYHVYSLPYATIAVGVGGGRRCPVPGLGAAEPAGRRGGRGHGGVLLGAQEVNVFAQSLQDKAGVFGSCAIALDAVSTPSDLAVVSTTSRTSRTGDQQ